MPAPGRIVICGGGVIGAAIAYELAQRGHPAVIVEADGVASGASGAAAGILTPPPPDSDDPLDELRRLSYDMHADLARRLPEESGIDYGYTPTPGAILATTHNEERQLRALAARHAAAGLDGRWLDAAQLAEETGWIDRGATGATVLAPSAQLDPYRFTLALVTAAERLGAELRSGRVTGLDLDAGHVTTVRLERETIEADTVVIAMGPWSAEAGSWLSTLLPIEPLKGQIVKVRPARELPTRSFGHAGNYAITKPGGLVFLGTTEERAGFDPGTTEEARDAILAWALRFSSALDDAEIVEQTACLRPLSRDQRPLIGAVTTIQGAFVATGHGRQGILLAPATGSVVADLILEGATDRLDLAPYDPMRFSRA